jgi:hypothetical protein
VPQSIGKIGELLVERGKITEHQLNAALRNQGFFREHLGTTLYKMGFVDEETLGEALAELSGVPYAPPSLFRDLPASLISLLPVKLAEKHDIIPLKLEGRKLHVAMLDPRDLLVLDEVAFITGYTIQPWIAPEFRLYDALERYYQVVSKRRRTIKLADGGDTRPAAAAAGRTAAAPAAGRPSPSPASRPSAAPAARAAARQELGLDGKPLDAPPDLTPPPPLPAAEATAPPPAAPALTLEAAGRALQKAETRDDVAEAMLAYASGQVRRAALFIHQKERVLGWAGRGDGLDPARLRELQLPLDAPSIFTTLGGGRHYLGGVPDTPANREIYQALGGKVPGFILLAPIVIKGRPAAVLYADDAGQPLTAKLEDLLKLSRMAAIALEILILRAKIMMA